MRPLLLTLALVLPGATAPPGDPSEVVAAAKLERVEAVVQRDFGAYDKSELYASGCHAWWGISTPRVCSFNRGRVEIVVSGDSHAAAWFPGLKIAAARQGAVLHSITKAGCPIVSVRVKVASDSGRPANQPYPECDAWQKLALARIVKMRPDLVVLPLLTRRPLYGEAAGLAPWRRGIFDVVHTLTRAGIEVLVLGDVPQAGLDVPACVKQHRAAIKRCATPAARAVRRANIDASREAAERAGATFLDVSGWFCTPSTCPAVIANTVVYRDSHHLAARFAQHLAWRLAPTLETRLDDPGK